MVSASRSSLALLGLVTLAGCPAPQPAGDGGNDADAATDAAVDAAPPPMACRAGTTWAGTQPAFRGDDTPGWGLAAARGTNLSVADLDGDGWADLIVLDGATNARSDLAATPPVVHVRVYMNRPRDGGGRTFVDATQTSNLLALHTGTGYGRATNQLVFADVDNDGDVDAVTGVYVNTAATAPTDPGDRSVVMLNDGHGVFSFANDSGITGSDLDVPQTGGIAFTDQNRDGNIDVFMGYWYDPTASAEVGQQHQLFRGHG
ncbi:MAG: VCBS repeat-containing protein, partial [Deltaproteobacteria bacterium]